MKRQTLFLSFLVCCLLAPTLILAKDAPWTPLKGKSQIRVIDVQWANPAQPFSNATSLFDGRCTVPSNYIITFSMVGEVTHLGRITGIAEHCTQLNFGANNVPVPTYSDGEFTETAANGDKLWGTYTDGTSGGPDANGLLWFHDILTITGGTGRFLEAKGGGEEFGTFNDFIALLGGAPAQMWMEGTISYKASDRR